MSRCLKCNRVFAEEDAWQEFCSLPCAQKYIVGKRIADLDMSKSKDRTRHDVWNKWISVDKNNRRVRLSAEPEPPPKVGRFEDRIVEWVEGKKKKLIKVRVNVGSEIIVRPMTDSDRAALKRYRGRGFGDDHKYNPMAEDVPSAHGQVGRGWFPHDE